MIYLQNITILDILDILIVTAIIYYLLMTFRGIKALQMTILLLIILLLFFAAQWLQLNLLHYLSSVLLVIWGVFFLLIFQPEFRNILTKVSKLPLFSFILREAVSEEEAYINEIIEAVMEMSSKRIGALIVFEQNTDIRNYIDNAVILDAVITKELLVTIFSLNTPLHDGAVIIRNGRVYAARCVLPLPEGANIPREFGTRHRAAVGLSELTDAGVIVISEETKRISFAHRGQFLTRGMNRNEVKDILYDLLIEKEKLGQETAGPEKREENDAKETP